MTEVMIEQVLDEEVELVKTERIGGVTLVQLWYGGQTVRVFTTMTGQDETWNELSVWTMSDEEGLPVSRSEIGERMETEWEYIRDEWE